MYKGQYEEEGTGCLENLTIFYFSVRVIGYFWCFLYIIL